MSSDIPTNTLTNIQITDVQTLSDTAVNEVPIAPPGQGSSTMATSRLNWPDSVTSKLLEIWSDADIQAKLKGKTFTTKRVFQLIATKLNTELNTEFTAEQCANKVKTLKKRYEQFAVLAKSGSENRLPGILQSFPHYTIIDTVLGTSPLVEPSTITESNIQRSPATPSRTTTPRRRRAALCVLNAKRHKTAKESKNDEMIQLLKAQGEAINNFIENQTKEAENTTKFQESMLMKYDERNQAIRELTAVIRPPRQPYPYTPAFQMPATYNTMPQEQYPPSENQDSQMEHHQTTRLPDTYRY